MRETDLCLDVVAEIEHLLWMITRFSFPRWSLISYSENGDGQEYIVESHDSEERYTITRRYDEDDQDTWSIQQITTRLAHTSDNLDPPIGVFISPTENS